MKRWFILLHLICSTLAADNFVMCSMAIGVEYQRTVAPAIASKAEYCRKQGYPFHNLTYTLDPNRPIPWSKILLVEKLLEDCETDWVFWSDADAIVMNKKIKLKRFVDENYDMIVGSDDNGINTGQFLMRNCEWSKDFLKRVYAKTEYIHHGWWEQKAIMDLYANNPEDKKHIKVLPQRDMNSYTPQHGPIHGYQKGDFIIHFAGIRGQDLINLIEKWSKL